MNTFDKMAAPPPTMKSGYLQIQNEGESLHELQLPPGYRFHPTDEELVSYYLLNKIYDFRFNVPAIAEVDLNKCEPWELPYRAKMGEKEWYFYSLRDRKYPTGLRTNRATESGYWKATGKDREVTSSRQAGTLVGMKKTLVFYRGRAPKGEKSNWIMHEYRLEGDHYPALFRPSFNTNARDEWVVCRVFRKNLSGKKIPFVMQPLKKPPPSSNAISASLPALQESSNMSLHATTTATTTTSSSDDNSSEAEAAAASLSMIRSLNAAVTIASYGRGLQPSCDHHDSTAADPDSAHMPMISSAYNNPTPNIMGSASGSFNQMQLPTSSNSSISSLLWAGEGQGLMNPYYASMQGLPPLIASQVHAPINLTFNQINTTHVSGIPEIYGLGLDMNHPGCMAEDNDVQPILPKMFHYGTAG